MCPFCIGAAAWAATGALSAGGLSVLVAVVLGKDAEAARYRPASSRCTFASGEGRRSAHGAIREDDHGQARGYLEAGHL
jgi:hypothetical protein